MKKILTLFLLVILLTSCGDKVDDKGFYIEGKNIRMNKITKSFYDEEGYDIDGYNKYGFNRNGYDKQGYNSLGYDKNGINRRGFDENGVYHNKYRFDKMLEEKGLSFEEAKEYCTPETREKIGMIEQMCEGKTDEMKAAKTKVEVASSKIEESGDKAKVILNVKNRLNLMTGTIEENTKQETVNLIKDEDKWRVIVKIK